MQLRGITFLPIDLYESDATRFSKPARAGSGRRSTPIPTISAAIAEKHRRRARTEGPFKSRDELMRRAGIGQSAIDALAAAGCLTDLPESAQMDYV